MAGSSPRPLEGVRIADLTAVWAGPYCAQILADCGAEVIKIEAPQTWDNIRTHIFPPETQGEHWWNLSPFFHQVNHSKKSLTLDLKQARGKEIFGRLVAHCDVVLENFRPGVVEDLRITPDWLRQQRADIIVVGMTGFGKTGPESQALAFGPIVEQLSELMPLTGYGDGIPMKTGVFYPDPVGGTAGVGAVAIALIQRRRTGKGQVIDLAHREVMSTFLGEAFMDWSMNQRLHPHLGNGHEWMARPTTFIPALAMTNGSRSPSHLIGSGTGCVL